MQWKTKGYLRIFLDVTVAFDKTSSEATAIAVEWHMTLLLVCGLTGYRKAGT
jgi:hypothetical protein